MSSASSIITLTLLSMLLATQPVLAQESGVLLGIHLSSASSGSEYRTFWIAPVGGTPRLVAAGPDLLVPRKSGFWRVCLVAKRDTSDGQLFESDTLIAGAATRDRGRCSIAVDSVTDAMRQAVRCSGSELSAILFVGGDYVSVERNDESNCGAHPSGASDVSLRSLDDGRSLEVLTLLSGTEQRALRAATLRAAHKAFDDIGTVGASRVRRTGEEAFAQFTIDRQWAVERGAGHWQAVGLASCTPHVACGDENKRFSIPAFSLGARVVGHDILRPSLAAIKSAVPGVRDAVSSPRGEMVVALTDDSLFVLPVSDGRLGSPVAILEVSGTIVMAQWAVGSYIPVWTRQITALLR